MDTMRGGKPDHYGLMSINVRVPPECYAFLVNLAKSEYRSLGAQCAVLLERAVDRLQNPTETPVQT